jgi:hypothetical protein
MPQSTLFGAWRLPNRPPTTTCLPDPLGFIATNLLPLGGGKKCVNMIRVPLGD